MLKNLIPYGKENPIPTLLYTMIGSGLTLDPGTQPKAQGRPLKKQEKPGEQNTLNQAR